LKGGTFIVAGYRDANGGAPGPRLAGSRLLALMSLRTDFLGALQNDAPFVHCAPEDRSSAAPTSAG
jgi:hypothetical protein